MSRLHWLARAAICLTVALLAACAADVRRQQTQWQPLSGAPETIELRESVTLEPSTGYKRVLLAGSLWRETGRIPEGRVYRPVDGVLTAEGRNVLEAYLVLDGGRVVGFYLPTEQAFAVLPSQPINYQNKGN